uniref:Dynein light chain n=1 Tax=Rhabditophanes sp. KR3021 TaxID=114890 RepID=A0AC35U7Q6_9BILA
MSSFQSLRRKFNNTRNASKRIRAAVLNVTGKSFLRKTSGNHKPIPVITNLENIDDWTRDRIVEIVDNALQDGETESKVASKIKTKCDESLGMTWHCIIGRSFGSHVSFEQYIHLTIDKCIKIVIFKCG